MPTTCNCKRNDPRAIRTSGSRLEISKAKLNLVLAPGFRAFEARFSVFFIVDTTGRIDATTIEVPPSVDVRFANAVRDVLVRWHFFPAEVRGRRVRQLMEQPFEFRIVNARLARAGAT